MIKNTIISEYNRWLKHTEGSILEELRGLDEESIEDAFYCELEFGTGGLRGVIGAGTNRMNEYVVARATQGVAAYILRTCGDGEKSVVIGYDSRIKSDVFAEIAACVLAANGIKAYIWSELLPVSTVSYAVRELSAAIGIMITASHNPANYNGYKVYGPDGCQITTQMAKDIYSEICNVDYFSDVKKISLQSARDQRLVVTIDDSVLTAFIESVKRQSVLWDDEIQRDLAIVYTPLNGAGLKPVIRVLSECGFTNISVVQEQSEPDGRFPTCPYPNPEVREAMELGIEYCKRLKADILIATDPDSDRCGIAVCDADGEYRLLNGNETGLLILDFICSQRVKHGKMPGKPVFVKTIVTTDPAESDPTRSA